MVSNAIVRGLRTIVAAACVPVVACAPDVERPSIGAVERVCQEAMQEPPTVLVQLPVANHRVPIPVPLGELVFHNREFVRVAGVAAGGPDRRYALYSSLAPRVPVVHFDPRQLWDLWPDMDTWDRDLSAWLHHCVVMDG